MDRKNFKIRSKLSLERAESSTMFQWVLLWSQNRSKRGSTWWECYFWGRKILRTWLLYRFQNQGKIHKKSIFERIKKTMFLKIFGTMLVDYWKDNGGVYNLF